MAVFRLSSQNIDLFLFSRRSLLFFLIINLLLLFSGLTSLTWGLKPPLPTPPAPSFEATGIRVSLSEKLQLEQAPESWGLPITDSHGKLYYTKEYYKVVLFKINLKGLFRNHRYILSLIGKPWHESNQFLPKGDGKERFYDFTEVVTDDKGSVERHLSLDLRSGKYNVKFFVKDPRNEWKVVLYNDFLIFTVK